MANEITPITDAQKLRLDILALVQNDTAAAKDAISFVSDDPLKYELFQRNYTLSQAEPTPVSRTTKDIQGAKDSLSLFQ